MRKCLRCNVEMVEDLDVKVEGGAYGLKVTILIFHNLMSTEKTTEEKRRKRMEDCRYPFGILILRLLIVMA